MSNPQLVIHLVHGTWGRGVLHVVNEELGWSQAPHPPFWFEAGSGFREAIAGDLQNLEIEYREFKWSGSNSFRARTAAAEHLREYLEQELETSATKHVLIGHSHAGNVIVEALTRDGGVNGDQKLVGVLTLASPFLAIESSTDSFNLLLHALLPLVIAGYGAALVGFEAASGHWNAAGWLFATALAYFTAMTHWGRQPAWRWVREGLFWAMALSSLYFVSRGVLPWFSSTYPKDSWLGAAAIFASPIGATILGLANFGFLLAARTAGATRPDAHMTRDIVHALAGVYGCTVLLAGSIRLWLDGTACGYWFWVFLCFWPFIALFIVVNTKLFRRTVLDRSIDVWKTDQEEQEKVHLPCNIHAMRLPSDEASLAIVASQLMRAATTSPRIILDWINSLHGSAAYVFLGIIATLSAPVGYIQFADFTVGWWRLVGLPVGALLGIVGFGFAILLSVPVLLLLAVLSYSLVGLAVGIEVFRLLPAARIACEPLPRVPSEQACLSIIWPTAKERSQLPMRHSMYDLDSVRDRVAKWIIEIYKASNRR